MVPLQEVLEWFSQQGFPEIDLEEQGTLLVVKLSLASRSRLFAEEPLRQQLVSRAKQSGFDRIALDLTG